MRKFLALAVVATGLAATPAVAQSTGGLYVGALGGY